MTTTELRDKYQDELTNITDDLEYKMPTPLRQWYLGKHKVLTDVISDLNTLIQSGAI
jgi:hypothetical protein